MESWKTLNSGWSKELALVTTTYQSVYRLLLCFRIRGSFRPFQFLTVIYTFFLFFLFITGFTQNRITGIVSGKNNLPLSGATVSLKNSDLSISTGTDGVYSIDAKKGDIMLVSFIGYKSSQIKIGNNIVVKSI